MPRASKNFLLARSTHCPVIASVAMQLRSHPHHQPNISPGDSPPCSRLQFILRAPHRLRIISLLVSLQSSLLPPRGSSTSSFTGASHLQSVSKLTSHTRVSRRLLRLRSSLVETPFLLIQQRPITRSIYMSLQLAVAGTFPTRFNRTDYRHLDTHFIWTLEHWFILSCHVSFILYSSTYLPYRSASYLLCLMYFQAC